MSLIIACYLIIPIKSLHGGKEYVRWIWFANKENNAFFCLIIYNVLKETISFYNWHYWNDKLNHTNKIYISLIEIMNSCL